MNSEDDKLGEQLRREAMAERPAYSRELHERMMRGIHAGRAAPNWRWPALAAAAAIAIAIGAVWMSQTKQTAPPAVQIVTKIQPKPLKIRPDASVDIAGLVSARAWPPAIGVRVPGVQAREVSSLQEKAAPSAPLNNTQQRLAGMLPTEVRALIFMSVNATE